jgi:hypothetical protein
VVEVARVLVLFTGVLAGVLHVLSGPDHLAAVAPLSALGGPRATAIGATWGAGHGGGALVWLALAWLLRGSVASDRIGVWAELCVGASLLVLGALAALGKRHVHRHAHDQGRRVAFGFGLLHGLAGAGHVLLAIPALGLASHEAALYLGGYFGAAIATMASVAALIASVGTRSGDPLRVSRACGALAMLVGVYWIANTLLA